MALWKPDPSFYPSPRMASQAPPERLAYVVAFDPGAALKQSRNGSHDSLNVIDVDAGSSSYGQIVGRLEIPSTGDELHHFGWNACSAALCPYAPHPHVERRYLIVPGIRSSRINIVDTKPNPRKPSLVRVIEPEEVASRAGYSRPHTVHCGPDAIYVSALGAPNGAKDRAEFSCSIARASTCSGDGKSNAVRRFSLMISGGISATTSRSPANGARPR